MAVLAVALAMAAAACGGGGGDSDLMNGAPDDRSTNTSAPAPTSTVPAAGARATDLTLRIADVRLLNSEESDNGMRILLPAGVSSASVTLTGVPSPNRVISVCQARELDRRMDGASCRTPANGEATRLTLGGEASGFEIVQIGVAGAGASGNTSTLDEVVVRYSAASREVNMRLPQIAAGDAGARPTLRLTPGGDGTYRASLTWTVIPVFGGSQSNGRLELVQDGAVTSSAQSGGEVRLSGNVAGPVTDVAIRAQNVGQSAMLTPKLSAVLP